MTDDFDFKLIKDFAGYASSPDKTKADPNILVRGSKNVYKTDAGNISVRPGLKRRGDADSSQAGITSSFEWYTSLGAVLPLRVVDETSSGSDAQLQVEFDGDWYSLLTGQTLTRFVFDTWWDDTEKKDRLLFVKGDDNLQHWSGGITKVAAQAFGGSTLTKSDTTETFAQAGFSTTSGEKTFTINGSTTVYTYTGGENTTTLTGITPALPLISADTVIIQSVLTETDTPAAGFNNDFIRTVNNQVYVGSYTSRLVYISNDTDFTDFTVPTPREPGDPDIITLDDSAKGITVRKGQAHISAGLSDWYVVSFNQITVGAALTEQTIVDKKKLANLSAAYAHEFIDTVGDDIVYLAQDQQVRIYGEFRSLFEPKFPSLSQAIKQELKDEDFTGGALRSVGDFIYLTAPISGNTYLYERREAVNDQGNVIAERLWHPPQVWNISRVAVINGVEFGHSNQNPQMYQLWDTDQWHDDSPTNDAVPYDCVARFSYSQHGRRQGLLSFDKVYYEGYILSNSPLTSRIYYDYLGANGTEEIVINDIDDSATLFSDLGVFGLGANEIGEQIIGGGVSGDGEEFLPKFRCITNTPQIIVFEYELEVFSTEADSRWELIALGTNATLSSQQATFIQK